MKGRLQLWLQLGAVALVGGWLVMSGCQERSPVSDDGRGPPKSPRFEEPEDALFADDFSEADLSGWTSDGDGVWRARDGVLRAQLPDRKQMRAFLRAGGSDWTNYAVDLDVCMTRGVDKGVAVRVSGDEGVAVDLRGPGYHDVLLQRGWSLLGKAPVENPNGKWHHIRLEARGTRYRVFVNGKRLIDEEDSGRTRGGIALAAYTGGIGRCTVYYDNVSVTMLDGTHDDTPKDRNP
jgi:hypothetical protein